MRPLDEKETTSVFEKLMKFIGPNLAHIINIPSLEGPTTGVDVGHGGYVFRLHKNYVYYASDFLIRRTTNVFRNRLTSFDTCIGKFTKTDSFCLTVHCFNLLAVHARNNVWLKPAAEMSFLYGNSVIKGGLGRTTENTSCQIRIEHSTATHPT